MGDAPSRQTHSTASDTGLWDCHNPLCHVVMATSLAQLPAPAPFPWPGPLLHAGHCWAGPWLFVSVSGAGNVGKFESDVSNFTWLRLGSPARQKPQSSPWPPAPADAAGCRLLPAHLGMGHLAARSQRACGAFLSLQAPLHPWAHMTPTVQGFPAVLALGMLADLLGAVVCARQAARCYPPWGAQHPLKSQPQRKFNSMKFNIFHYWKGQ